MTPSGINDAGAAAPVEDDAASAGVADLSQGYVIEVLCMPDGTYSVHGPEPMQEEAEEGEPAGESYKTLGEALKQVMVVIKENPMSNDNAQMQAGYDAE